MTIAIDERERLIGRVYADANDPGQAAQPDRHGQVDPGGRNGGPLIMTTVTVTEADLRRLANDRATAVRDRLSEQEKVPRERLFLVAPLLDGSGNAKLPPARVDFSLK